VKFIFSQNSVAERQKKVAHGISRGKPDKTFSSCGAAAENSRYFLSPLPGLGQLIASNPQLALWATVARVSGAGTYLPFIL